MPQRYTSFDSIPLALRVEEVASILSIGRNTAYELVRCGELESIKVGRQIRIPKHAVERYLNHRKDKGN